MVSVTATTVPIVGQCKDCGRDMVSQPIWRRHPEVHEGRVRQGGRGLCSRDYIRAWRARTRPEPASPRLIASHCRNGHEFTADNVAYRRGTRVCLTCDRARSVRYRRRTQPRRRQDYIRTHEGHDLIVRRDGTPYCRSCRSRRRADKIDQPHKIDQYDETTVQRVLAGEKLPGLARADRIEITRRILADGDGASRVTKVLRCNGTEARKLVAQVGGSPAKPALKPPQPKREPDKSGLPVVAKVGEIPVHLRRKAVRTIASHAVDATEAAELLDMLGLTAGDGLEVAR